MNVRTIKIGTGLYSVAINGRTTGLVIAKCEAPRYRENQSWAIGHRVGDETRWITSDQRSLANAVETVRTIAAASST
jgi:hypothetical protein